MASERRRGANPFATSRVRPGALEFHFAPPLSLEQLLTRIDSHVEWQIVGPHGSGKSTLVHSLVQALECQGRQCERVRIGPGQRTCELPSLGRQSAAHPRLCLVVDGYEQLSWWTRWRLRRAIRRRAATLIVTCHRDLGWPSLLTMQPSLETALHLVDRLQSGYSHLLQPAEVAALWEIHQPNLRELLFGLYDLYEQRRGDAQMERES